MGGAQAMRISLNHDFHLLEEKIDKLLQETKD